MRTTLVRGATGPRPRAAALAALAALVASGCAPPREPLPPALEPALGSISGEAIGQHMRRLADDALAGRGTGSGGFDVAADYVATRFTELGLEPLGGDGDYLQPVPLLRADPIYAESELAVAGPAGRTVLEPEADYVLHGDFLREVAELSAPLVYAGFGVVAPGAGGEPGHDDYAGLDVRERIVVVHSGAPATLPADVHAHFSAWREKERAAAQRGAVGLLIVQSDADARRFPWERGVAQARLGAMRWLDANGQPADVRAELYVVARLSRAGFARLLAGTAQDAGDVARRLAAGRPRGFEIGARLEARTATRHQVLQSANVAARLAGSDAARAREHVVVTAHLDHLGVGVPSGDDAIYNGAYDNASGVAVLLEIARALASLEQRPARSIVFLAVTAEEPGLVGSDYFAAHPTVPAASVVANLNLDMVMMLHPLADVIGYGAAHTTLGALLERAAAQCGLAVSQDPVPEDVVFIRGDQYSFVRRGIPALFVVPGSRGERAGGRSMQRWLERTWHTPADDLSQPFDLAAGAAFARLETLLLWHVTAAPDAPAWLPGDFFATRAD